MTRAPELRRLAATLVIAVAAGACSSGSDTPDLSGLATSPSIDLVGIEMEFIPDEVAVEAGAVPARLVNEGTVIHDLRIEGVPFLLEAEPGEEDEGVVELEPGLYEIWCSIPGHREAGMEGWLEVR